MWHGVAEWAQNKDDSVSLEIKVYRLSKIFEEYLKNKSNESIRNNIRYLLAISFKWHI